MALAVLGAPAEHAARELDGATGTVELAEGLIELGGADRLAAIATAEARTGTDFADDSVVMRSATPHASVGHTTFVVDGATLTGWEILERDGLHGTMIEFDVHVGAVPSLPGAAFAGDIGHGYSWVAGGCPIYAENGSGWQQGCYGFDKKINNHTDDKDYWEVTFATTAQSQGWQDLDEIEIKSHPYTSYGFAWGSSTPRQPVGDLPTSCNPVNLIVPLPKGLKASIGFTACEEIWGTPSASPAGKHQANWDAGWNGIESEYAREVGMVLGVKVNENTENFNWKFESTFWA